MNLRWISCLSVVLGVVLGATIGLGGKPARAAEHAAASEGGGEAGEAAATGPFYYKLDALLAPIVEKRRVKGYAEIVVTLEVADREGEKAVRDKTLVLRDEFLRDLQFQAGMRSEGDPAISLRRIKARFKVLAARVVGEGIVSEVLIESAIYHGT